MAVLIDATSEYLIRTSGPPTRAAFSACGWARRTDYLYGYQNLIALEVAGLPETNQPAVHLIGFHGNDLYLFSAGTAEVLFSSSPSLDDWFFWYISASADGENGGWAVPGASFVTASLTGIYNAAVASMTLGNDTFTEPLVGNLAHVKVWTATVPPAELQQEMYRGTPKRLTDLHLWSPLLVNSNDYSGNGRDWTEGGTLTWEADPPVPLIVTDDFNRADSSALGPNWLEVQNTNWQILSNRLYITSGAYAKLKWIGASVGSHDQYCQAERWASNWHAVLVRCTGTTDVTFHAYAAYFNGTSLRLGWIHETSGWGAYLDSGITTIPAHVDGDVCRLEVEGQDDDIVLRFYLNDTLYKTLTKAQFTDQDAVLNSGEPGLFIFATGEFDNFKAGPLLGAHGLAWGEQNPDETASSWQTWETSPGTPINVSGDEDWGAAMVASGTPCYGPVVDTQNAYSKTFTVEHDVYAQGGGDVAIYIRGSATSFGQHDGSPSWAEYSAPVTEHWRYVQLKMEQG